MGRLAKVVVVSQHYPPDIGTTAAIMSAIAERLATEAPVLVLSGTSGSATSDGAPADRPAVVEIKNWIPAKAALIRRAVAEISFTVRVFVALLTRLQPGDLALAVTAPFALPYAVAAAARLKHARSVLIMHDLYPDVLVVAGLLTPGSILARVIHGANALMFRALNVVIVIGRDTERLLARYRGVTRDKLCFIPNWTTLNPGVRSIDADNPYRRLCGASFVVGLSGNLGFTHDPVVVFEAARLLGDDRSIHFLLSGWGIGFDQLRALQAEARLANVTLVERVPDGDLEALLAAADVWVIPYRKNVAGVSIPSRFYNLLAIGRPVVLISEPDAEAALIITENNLGWVVMPDRSDELAKTIRLASVSRDASMAARAVAVAGNFSRDRAMTSYADLICGLLQNPSHTGRRT